MLRRKADLETLNERRSKARIKMLHEIYHSTKQVNKEMIPTKQRCANLKFNPIRGRIQIYANSFIPNTVELWNKLPKSLVNTKDLDEFKKEMNKISISDL